MIQLERTSVMNLENAMRGARNPLNSWSRMDSSYDEFSVIASGFSEPHSQPQIIRAQNGCAHPHSTSDLTVSLFISPN